MENVSPATLIPQSGALDSFLKTLRYTKSSARERIFDSSARSTTSRDAPSSKRLGPRSHSLGSEIALETE